MSGEAASPLLYTNSRSCHDVPLYRWPAGFPAGTFPQALQLAVASGSGPLGIPPSASGPNVQGFKTFFFFFLTPRLSTITNKLTKSKAGSETETNRTRTYDDKMK